MLNVEYVKLKLQVEIERRNMCQRQCELFRIYFGSLIVAVDEATRRISFSILLLASSSTTFSRFLLVSSPIRTLKSFESFISMAKQRRQQFLSISHFIVAEPITMRRETISLVESIELRWGNYCHFEMSLILISVFPGFLCYVCSSWWWSTRVERDNAEEKKM